ncbi:hypothetical protein MPRM_09730 [Mycobacterium parmense]|uniref:Uncharacterized protein n=1 Tax=Mycobacterium parmense TaxID=185642 RepID=A0A7I7YRB2_9MYCO|nr:hypothetical protein MPRM_09730 [Mycobacterium parmense]
MSACPAPDQLPAHERERLLSEELDRLTRPTSFLGSVGAGGLVTLSARGPKVVERGRFKGVVSTGPDYNLVVANLAALVLTCISCGLYLPFWWWALRKKPPVYTVSVDRQGEISSVQHEITQRQRIIKWVVMALLVAYVCTVLYIIGEVNSPAPPQHAPVPPLSPNGFGN